MTPDTLSVDRKVPRAVKRLPVFSTQLRAWIPVGHEVSIQMSNNRSKDVVRWRTDCLRSRHWRVQASAHYGRRRVHRKRHHRSINCGRSHGYCLRQSFQRASRSRGRRCHINIVVATQPSSGDEDGRCADARLFVDRGGVWAARTSADLRDRCNPPVQYIRRDEARGRACALLVSRRARPSPCVAALLQRCGGYDVAGGSVMIPRRI